MMQFNSYPRQTAFIALIAMLVNGQLGDMLSHVSVEGSLSNHLSVYTLLMHTDKIQFHVSHASIHELSSPITTSFPEITHLSNSIAMQFDEG